MVVEGLGGFPGVGNRVRQRRTVGSLQWLCSTKKSEFVQRVSEGLVHARRGRAPGGGLSLSGFPSVGRKDCRGVQA